MIRTVAVTAAGHLLLLALAYYWLGLPASSAGSLALAGILALVLLALAAYLVALGFSRDPRRALSRIPVIILWLVLTLLVLAALTPVWGWSTSVGNWLASALTFGTRTPFRPQWLITGYQLLVGLVAGLIHFGILLPAAARASETGSLRDWRPVLSPMYLASGLAYMLVGFWIPLRLFWWIPAISSFEGQWVSFLFRAGAAFALYVACWLIFAWSCRHQALTPEVEHAR